MNNDVKSITIVGGGTAGLISALILQYKFSQNNLLSYNKINFRYSYSLLPRPTHSLSQTKRLEYCH